MDNRGLLFIPDISGFTRFVNQTDIEHSRLIIQELLEVLINANEIDLEVSEIEGDAILFYRFGETPDLGAIYRQVEKMFCTFHQHLNAYDITRFCQCTACKSAVNLTLKVITHYGEFAGYNVKSFNKLIGKDVIIAHQLLKNDIDQHEYWLVTKDMLKDSSPAGYAHWMKWNTSVKRTETGDVEFHFTQLSDLKNEITPETPVRLELNEKVKVASASREYETDIISLFHAAGDFHYRSRWQKGVRSVEELSPLLPRVGMRCRSIMENGEEIKYASSFSFDTNKIEFSETNENKTKATYYTLEKKDDKKIKLTLDYYIPKNIIKQIAFSFLKKKKVEQLLEQSLVNLDAVVKEIKLPGLTGC